jgi:catechol-2,3-dioxygenase
LETGPYRIPPGAGIGHVHLKVAYVELTRERPHDEWPRHADGSLRLAMADPLDVTGLISELG